MSSEELVINGYAIDAKLLERKSITRCDLRTCKGGCCADGVWVDKAHADIVLAHAEQIKPYMPEERRDTATWFAEEHDDDPAFPSGRYIGTTTVNDATHPSGTTCRFLRPEDRFCAIQVAAAANGLDPWAWKPLYCCAFPVVDEHVDDDNNPLPVKRLTIDDTNDLFTRGGGCHDICAGEPQPMFQIYAEEIALMIGRAGYRELCIRMGETPRL